MNLDIVKALNILRPDSTWTLQGDDYSAIEWSDKKTKAPSIEEVNSKISELAQIEAQNQTAKATQKAALLERLGISEAEAKLLLA